MLRPRCLLAGLLAMALSAAPGCDRPGQTYWEVAAENKNDTACSFSVTLGPDGGSKANVNGITSGKPVTLITGPGDTVVNTIKVVRGADDETVLTPNATLQAGKRYLIVVAADGKVETSIVSR
jgi:hypothetical protein